MVFSEHLPVLETVVRWFVEHEPFRKPSVGDIARAAGTPIPETMKALQALSPTYLTLGPAIKGDDEPAYEVERVTDEGRRAVGQWPTPEGIVDRLVQGLLDAADQEPDEQKRSRLRAVAEGFRGFVRDVAVGVISNAATAPLK